MSSPAAGRRGQRRLIASTEESLGTGQDSSVSEQGVEKIEAKDPAHRSEPAPAARLTDRSPSRRERGAARANYELKATAASTANTPQKHTRVDIKLPDGPLRNVNMECNAPLSSINARVEKVHNVYGVYRGFAEGDTSPEVSAVAVSSHGQQPAVVFHSLPRAHDSAVEVRQRTLERQQEKEARLDAFLENTRARVGSVSVLKPRGAADDDAAMPAVMDEKTRRRLDQSMSLLLPRASASSVSRSKRVRAWEGQAPRSEGGVGVGKGDEEALMAASDIAAALGDAVLGNISDGQRARESLFSHRRKHQVPEDTPPSPSRSSEMTAVMTSAMGTDRSVTAAMGTDRSVVPASIHGYKLDESVNYSLAREVKGTLKEGSDVSLGYSVSGPAWEGEDLRALREKENQLAIYKHVRRSLMMGERTRVRQLRERREEVEERERTEDAMRKERELLRRRRAAEEEFVERERQIIQQAAMAVNLEAERARLAKVSAPQRAALEKKRYLEALRCQILEGATQVAANHKGAGAAADKVMVGWWLFWWVGGCMWMWMWMWMWMCVYTHTYTHTHTHTFNKYMYI
jgi:hypothetical protein